MLKFIPGICSHLFRAQAYQNKIVSSKDVFISLPLALKAHRSSALIRFSGLLQLSVPFTYLLSKKVLRNLLSTIDILG